MSIEYTLYVMRYSSSLSRYAPKQFFLFWNNEAQNGEKYIATLELHCRRVAYCRAEVYQINEWMNNKTATASSNELWCESNECARYWTVRHTNIFIGALNTMQKLKYQTVRSLNCCLCYTENDKCLYVLHSIMRVMSTNGKASNEIKINQWENNRPNAKKHARQRWAQTRWGEMERDAHMCRECEYKQCD